MKFLKKFSILPYSQFYHCRRQLLHQHYKLLISKSANDISKKAFHTTNSFRAQFPFLFLNSGPYATEHSTPPPDALRTIYQQTLNHPRKNYAISELQGSFLTFLTSIIKPKGILELGCFLGYSSLCFAEGLRKSGIASNNKSTIVTCELDPDYAKKAKENIEYCGFSDLIEVKVGNAIDTGYVEKVPHLSITTPTTQIIPPSKMGVAKHIHEFNEYVKNDPRVDQLLLPIFDGLTFIWKKKNHN
nr:13967_t:CDS:2 [Entrophospora candida]